MSEVVESKRQLLANLLANLRRALCAIALVAMVAPAAAQQPTSAQRDALRASCRNDFIAHCSGVQPGGKAAFMCLQKNLSSLSGACQQAVNAVAASAAPATQPAAAPPAAAPDAAKPAEASTTPAPPPAAAPAAKPAAKPPAQAAVAPAAAPAAAPPPPMMGRPLPLRAEIMLIRTTCGPDFRALCGDVAPGGGRVIACLRANSASLSPRCQGALAALQ